MILAQVVLENRFVRLEPYAESIKAEVQDALKIDPDAWCLMATAGDGHRFETWWATAMSDMATGARLAYAVRRSSDGVIVGTTSLFEIQPHHRRCELGATFYRPEVRGGVVNPSCKRLLLDHAFSAGALRVEILTDAKNAASRAAILKLGAVFEGILSKHKVTWTGRIRDTALFSIIDDDWPIVRDRLETRLAAF